MSFVIETVTLGLLLSFSQKWNIVVLCVELNRKADDAAIIYHYFVILWMDFVFCAIFLHE